MLDIGPKGATALFILKLILFIMPWQSLHAWSYPKIKPALFPDATSLLQIVIVAQSVAWEEFLKWRKKDFVRYYK